MVRFGKKQWLMIAIVTLLVAAPFISQRSNCLFNAQCTAQQKQVNWVSWLVSQTGGQLHFFDLLELFHKPNKTNQF